MLRTLRSSLVAQATFVIGVLFCIAVVRVLFLGALAWLERHDAAAIAATSALRSAIHELAVTAAAGEAPAPAGAAARQLAQHLASESLREAVARPGRDTFRAALQALQAQWQHTLAPALASGEAASVLAATRPFSAALDDLAAQLQAEQNRLRSIDLRQVVVTMLLVISLQLLALYALRRKLAVPLKELVETTERFRAGNLDIRVDYRAADEIGRMAHSFNTMADALAASHRELEERVERKVQRLAQANAALELLFRSSHALAQVPGGAGALEELLRRFQPLLPGLRLTLHLLPDTGHMTGQLITVDDDAPPGGIERREYRHQRYEVRSQGRVLGELTAHFRGVRAPVEWEGELIQALADLIGSTLMLGRQREHENRLLLLGERNTIARELHDSLAQSLSFMKIQVLRLQTLIAQGEDCEAVETVAEELRAGLNDAYRQLRELLITFRLDIGDLAFADALQEAVRDLARRSGAAILLHADSLAVALSATEQIHVLHVAREALANAVHHAEARRVQVRLRQHDDAVELLVEDDGKGMPVRSEEAGHHGIAIMRERARSIGGTLCIESIDTGGTRVRLRFRPGVLTQQARGTSS